MTDIKRRSLLAGMAALGATGCSEIGKSEWGSAALDTAEDWHRRAHRTLAGHQRLAREYAPEDRSPDIRGNGSTSIDTPEYQRALAEGFSGWKLAVSGFVSNPLSLSLAELRAMPQRSQITRHDCIEGWSAIGKWSGPRLADFLQAVGADLTAKYVGFRCEDRYLTSIDMPTALHPQTMMAIGFDGRTLPRQYGFPMRIRIPTKLGFKNPKHVYEIFVTNTYPGGYWENQGYNWFSGL